MRISDWSSDVCSSDLVGRADLVQRVVQRLPGADVAPAHLDRADRDLVAQFHDRLVDRDVRRRGERRVVETEEVEVRAAVGDSLCAGVQQRRLQATDLVEDHADRPQENAVVPEVAYDAYLGASAETREGNELGR